MANSNKNKKAAKQSSPRSNDYEKKNVEREDGNKQFQQDGKQKRYNERSKAPRSGSRRGRSPGNKRDSRNCASTEVSSRSQAGSLNDISWYNKNPELLVAAGAFPFPYRPGMHTGPFVSVWQNGSLTGATGSGSIPGVIVYSWVPSVGQSSNALSPISVTAKQIYARVRSAYSSALDADAPDFMMYLMALDSLFSYIGALKRLYRILTLWSPQNYAVPDHLLKAYNLDDAAVENLRLHRTELWQLINTLVLQSRKFTCPAIMDIFNRHYWMNDNVYADAPTPRAQFYMFYQEAYFQFKEILSADGETTASGLVMKASPFQAGATVQSLYNFGNSLLEALIVWDESYTINGYLMRAYDGVPSFVVEELDQGAQLEVVYSEEVLTQIHNARAVSYPVDWTQFTVNQDPATNAIISNLTNVPVTIGDQWYVAASSQAWVDLRSEQPTPAEVVIASRLHTMTSVIRDTSDGKTIVGFAISAGTEIVNAIYVVTDVGPALVPGGGVAALSELERLFVPAILSELHGSNDMFAVLQLQQFDWCPLIPWVKLTTAAGVQMNAGLLVGDINNLAIVEPIAMENLNRVCLYSEFGSFS